MAVSGSAVRHRFPKREDETRRTEAERTAFAVAQVVERLDVPRLDAKSSPPAEPAGVAAPRRLRPVVAVLDAMLMQRRGGTEEFTELAAAAARRLHVPVDEATRFFEAYESVGSQTCFLDFEPDSSRTGTFAATHVDEGAELRSTLLATVVERMKRDKSFARATLALLSDWASEVNGESPVLVSRSVDVFNQHVTWLNQVGYQANELMGAAHRVSNAEHEACLTVVPSVESSVTRLGRTARIGAPPEFGLNVIRSRRLPAQRDFHRVLFALACAWRAALLPRSS